MNLPVPSTAGTTRPYTRAWATGALLISVLLHAAAGLFCVLSGGFGSPAGSPAALLIQEISLGQSLSAPAPPLVEPAPRVATPRPADNEAAQSVQETIVEQPPATTAQLPPPGNAVLAATPLGLGMMHGYFSSLADGRTLREDIRGYYFELVESINRAWWDKAGLLREPLRQDGVFELLVRRDGGLVSLRMLQGTGSNQADRLLREIMNGATLPPLPASFTQEIFQAPLRIKAPSNLFRLNS